MTAHKPATPLPWILATREGMAAQYGACIFSEHYNRPGVVDGRGSVAEVRGPGTVESANQNAAYIVTAANAYPTLVSAIRAALAIGQVVGSSKAALSAILRELGELE